jgi:short-subunit dehydrogenase
MPIEDYAWHLGVNVWGVIHGIRTFIPIFLEQGEEAHVINTGSMASLLSTPFTPAYCMSKHAVISLSECLYHELQLTNAKIKVSVLCPAAVLTRIDKADRNRPDRFQPSDQGDATIPNYVGAALTESCQGGITAEEMADQALRAIAEDRFYILPEGGDSYRWKKLADLRLDDIRLGRDPTFIDPNQIKESE